jgi:XTP/dITP diphosphohydrolase
MPAIGPRLVLASHNAGKLREIAARLAPHGVAVVSAADLGLPEPEETGDSFAANARLKAHAAARASGLPALADDSGLSVDALGGAPGVQTADWAETPAGRDYPRAMARVRAMLEAAAAPAPHRARFSCTLCLAWPDGQDQIFEGQVEGHLAFPPRGSGGHGYDPIFVPDGQALSFAQMPAALKDTLGHRGRALSRLVAAHFPR